MNLRSVAMCALLSLVISGCGSSPPPPKQPDEANRTAVNKSVPAELMEGI